MALSLPVDETIRISFAICKPMEGWEIEDAVDHVTKFTVGLEGAGCAKSAIMKSVRGSWAAVFSIWDGAACAHDSMENWHEASESSKDPTSVVKLVESGWFQLSCQEHRDVSFAQLKVGNIVSLRRIYSSRDKHDVLEYCCLALLKAYFRKIEGLFSCTFYKSIDCKRIFGLGIWDTVESASAILDESKGSFGEVYWKDLGAEMLTYEVCQVVYVTEETALETFTNRNRPLRKQVIGSGEWVAEIDFSLPAGLQIKLSETIIGHHKRPERV
eukprot:Gb_06967 [translate_table: standard]